MSKKVVKNFITQGGKHCITTSLKQIFHYYGYPLSEEMLFGIGEGLDFTYINLATSPMVSGRSKVIEFEEILAARLGIKLCIKQSKDYSKVFAITKRMLDNNQPVLAYADMPFLPYLGMEADSHFGGHAILLFGYDDEQEHFYVSDRDNSDSPIRTPNGPSHEDYHLVGYSQMQLARSSNSRPFPSNNKYLEFDFANYEGINKLTLIHSISNVCKKMLNPPANLKGVNGILKFSKEVRKWNKFNVEKLKRAGITNYFQIHADGGTGGGIFRSMYGAFLLEAGEILQSNSILQIGNAFTLLSNKWDQIAEAMWELYETGNLKLIDSMSCNIEELYHQEVDLLVDLQSNIDSIQNDIDRAQR